MLVSGAYTESLIQQKLADIGFIQLVPVHETAVRSKHKLSRFDSQNSLSNRPNPNKCSLKPMAR